jgi:phage baseplate assembly protein V
MYYQKFFYGIVSDNQDPDEMGRIKVELKITGDETVSDWLPVLSLYASKDTGAFWLPEIGDQVLAAFFDEELSKGVVLGSVWTEENPPPESEENSGADKNKDGENNLRFIRSRAGSRIIMDDKDGDENSRSSRPIANPGLRSWSKTKS